MLGSVLSTAVQRKRSSPTGDFHEHNDNFDIVGNTLTLVRASATSPSWKAPLWLTSDRSRTRSSTAVAHRVVVLSFVENTPKGKFDHENGETALTSGIYAIIEVSLNHALGAGRLATNSKGLLHVCATQDYARPSVRLLARFIRVTRPYSGYLHTRSLTA